MHFVDLTAARFAKSTFGTYTVRFVDGTAASGVKSTKCTLAAVGLLALPTQRS